MSLALPMSLRLAAVLKRSLLIFPFVAFLLYLMAGGQLRSIWYTHASARIQKQYGDGLDTPLQNSDWGLMGQYVRQLGQWATAVTERPHLDAKPLTEALIARFPWMEGSEHSLHTPWGLGRAKNHVAASSQTGLVICVGSSNYHLASHLIASLRRVHTSSIPIEIAYAGNSDLQPQHQQFLQSLGPDISLINLLDIFPRAQSDLLGSGWAMKPFALLASRFPHAILVDADAVFLTPPDEIFETHPQLMRTGTLFYHDRAAAGGGDEGLQFVKAQLEAAAIAPSKFLENESLYFAGESWYEADSGVVCVDKSRPHVFLGLVFATWMNTKEVREEVSYRLFYGDKETFWIAMELSSTEYFFEPLYAGSMGKISGEFPPDPDQNKVELCGTHMLHMDHLGTTPFWINGGVYRHKSQPENGYAELTHYWAGNVDAKSKPQWWWIEGNVACLSEKGIRALDPSMRKTVDDILREATSIDEKIRHFSR